MDWFIFKTSRLLCQLALTIFYDFKAYGTRNVPLRGGVLLVSNHESFLDPVLVGVKVPRVMAFLAKSELFTNRWFGWYLRQLQAFPIQQGRGDIAAMRETIARLQEGYILNIFPEGSRSPNGKLQPLLNGAALIIRKAAVPVVPCVIAGSYRCWPKGRKLPRTGRLRVIYGAPMVLHHLKTEQINQRIDAAFAHLKSRLKDIIAREQRPWEFRSLVSLPSI